PVEDRLPVRTCIHGLEDAARRRAGVVHEWIAGHASHGAYTVALRADVAPSELPEQVCAEARRLCDRNRPRKHDAGDENLTESERLHRSRLLRVLGRGS